MAIDRKAQSLKTINLERLNKKLLNVLHRDTNWLLKASIKGPLSRDEAHALAQYAKLIKQLKAEEDAELAGMTEEQLKEFANRNGADEDDEE